MTVEKLRVQQSEHAEFLKENPVILIAAEAAKSFYKEVSKADFGLAKESRVKSDGYDVTLLDTRLEEQLTAELKVAIPHMRVVGEENGQSPLEDNHTSIGYVDPLDGTTTLKQWMKWMRLDWYKRRGMLPDCNIMIGEQYPGHPDHIGIGCVVRLQEKKIYYTDGSNSPVVYDLETGTIHNLVSIKTPDSNDIKIYARLPRHGKRDMSFPQRTMNARSKLFSAFKDKTPVSLTTDINETGYMIRFLKGEFDGVVILPMTGHIHDLVAAINITRTMEGVHYSNVVPQISNEFSQDYCEHGFIAARDDDTLKRLQQCVVNLYPAAQGPLTPTSATISSQ